MKLKDGFLLRELAGSYVVVPVGQAAVDLRGMITLNETGAFLWKQLQTPQTTQSLCDAMTEVYDVTSEKAGEDIARFLQMLSEHGLLEEETA